MKPWIVLLPVLSCLVGCGSERRYGDASGEAVRFTVHLERGYVRMMHNRQWTPTGAAVVTSDSAGGTTVSSGIGFSFSSTSVYLYGGHATGLADVFIQQLSWGNQAFTVPLTAGRELFLTIKAEGGREGWQSLGRVIIPASPSAHVGLRLTESMEQVTVTPTVPAAHVTSTLSPGVAPVSSAGMANASPAAPTAVGAASASAPTNAPSTSASAAASPAAASATATTTPEAPTLSASPPATTTVAPSTPPTPGPLAAVRDDHAEAPGLDTRGMPAVAPGGAAGSPPAPAGATAPEKKLPNIFGPPVPVVSPAAPYPDPALEVK